MNLIVAGGYAPGKFEVPSEGYDYIVAADSGYDTATNLGLVPDLVVGDFDSTGFADDLVKRGFEKLNRDKDYSDTEIALMRIKGDYDILGGGEGRVDHLFSIFSLFPRYRYPRYWFMRSDVLISLSGRYKLNLDAGDELSFFSPSGALISTDGLVWDMNETKLDLSFLSLSNRIKQKGALVDVTGNAFMRVAPGVFHSGLVERLH